MKKDVLITIKSIQTVEDEKDIIEFFTFGNMSKIKGEYKITYDETEITGFEGCKTTLLVDGEDMVTMQRKGNTNTNLTVEKGKKHHCHYGTEFGDFLVGVNANTITSSLTDDGGDLYFKYTIDINSSYISENEVYVNVKERFE